MRAQTATALLLTVAVLGLSTAAMAEEVAWASATPPTDWSGLFVGAQGGGGLAFTGWTFPVDSFFTLFDGNKSFNAVGSGGVVGGAPPPQFVKYCIGDPREGGEMWGNVARSELV